MPQDNAELKRKKKALAATLSEAEALLAESERERKALRAKYVSLGDKVRSYRVQNLWNSTAGNRSAEIALFLAQPCNLLNACKCSARHPCLGCVLSRSR